MTPRPSPTEKGGNSGPGLYCPGHNLGRPASNRRSSACRAVPNAPPGPCAQPLTRRIAGAAGGTNEPNLGGSGTVDRRAARPDRPDRTMAAHPVVQEPRLVFAVV
jgi:hypothetical protein